MVPTLVEFSHLLLTVNSSVNFLVYYLACGKHVCHIFRHRNIKRTKHTEIMKIFMLKGVFVKIKRGYSLRGVTQFC